MFASESLVSPHASSNWWEQSNQTGENQQRDDVFTSPEQNEKDCTIFAVDASDEMVNSGMFQNAVLALKESLKRKIIVKADDFVSVLLFNTKETKNTLELSNISVVQEPNFPSALLVQKVGGLVDEENFKKIGSLKNEQCDFGHVLDIAQRGFNEADPHSKKFGSKRLFILTQNDDPHRSDTERVVNMSNDLADSGVDITVIPLKPDFKLKSFFFKIMTIIDDEFQTEAQMQQCCRTLEEISETLRVKEFKKRALSSIPWTIKEGVNLGVKFYCMKRKTPKATTVFLDPANNQTVKCRTQWMCAESGTMLDDTQYKTYQLYGTERVFFTKDEMNTLKKLDDPSLRLLGFKSMDRLKPYHQMKPCYFVYPDEEGVSGSTVAFNALLTACSDLKKFALCRFTYKRTSQPRFVALLPQMEETDPSDGSQTKPPGFHMIFLPYQDDIRKRKLPPMKTAAEEEELIRKAKKLVDTLTMKGSVPEYENPELQRHYDTLEALALDEKVPEEIRDETVADLKTIQERGATAVSEFAAALPDAPPPPVKGKKRKAAGDGGRAKKKVKAEAGDGNIETVVTNAHKGGTLKKLKVAELKEFLGLKGLAKKGKKADLIERVQDYLSST